MGIPKGRVHVETNNKSGYQGFKENSDARVSLLPNWSRYWGGEKSMEVHAKMLVYRNGTPGLAVRCALKYFRQNQLLGHRNIPYDGISGAIWYIFHECLFPPVSDNQVGGH